MGDDRTQVLTEIHDAGSLTIAQDEESYGVAKCPWKGVGYCAVDEVRSMEEIEMSLI